MAHSVLLGVAFARADGTGGIVVDGNEVVSFRKQQPWVSGKGKLHERIRKEIRDGIRAIEPDNAKGEEFAGLLADAVIAVSEDPNAGCMLVISAAEAVTGFRDMGSPWSTISQEQPLSMTLDELKALMSMDGATCVSFVDGGPRVSFRRLATGDGGLQLTGDAQQVLDGEGSRKWIAALAAFHDKVKKIIAVSQDGPVYVFKRVGQGREAKVDVFRVESVVSRARKGATTGVKARIQESIDPRTIAGQ